jgi:AraC-like DNA-binding protein
MHPEQLKAYMSEPPWDTSIHPPFLSGEFDLSDMTEHFIKSVFPSPFARKHLLYLQLLASCTFPASHYTRRENLPSYLLAYTFYGTGRLLYRDREYELSAGDLFLINCADPHTYYAVSEDGWGYRFAHFDGAHVRTYLRQFERQDAVKFTFSDDSHFYRSFGELFLVNAESGPKQEILTNRILTDLLTELLLCLPSYQNKTLPDEIARQCTYLQSHYAEKISLEALAKQFRISKYHMCREFKKYTGQTILAYLTDFRLTMSKSLLRYSSMSIEEIAASVGYNDYNNFYRTFTHAEGMSPSEYRKYWNGL